MGSIKVFCLSMFACGLLVIAVSAAAEDYTLEFDGDIDVSGDAIVGGDMDIEGQIVIGRDRQEEAIWFEREGGGYASYIGLGGTGEFQINNNTGDLLIWLYGGDIRLSTNGADTKFRVKSSNGDMILEGDVSMNQDKKITQPEDSDGNGPFVLNPVVSASIQHFSRDYTYGYWKTSASGTTWPKLSLGTIPVEQFGAKVVIDSIYVYGETTSASAYFDEISIHETDRSAGGNQCAVYTQSANMGEDTATDFAVNILSSDLDRSVHSNALLMQFKLVNPNGDEVRIFDVEARYHLE